MLDALFAAVLTLIALLYSSVGQAGGTGYVALMGFADFAPDVIKPTALALNVLVAAIATVRFHRAGRVSWRTVYPFALLGLPFSVLGGALHLPADYYQPVVGLLLISAGILTLTPRSNRPISHDAPFASALVLGAVLGVLSGVTGVGGGIFLAPLISAFGWADLRKTAAISAAFNLLNSAAALAGAWATMPTLPAELPVWLICVAVGGLIGSWLGAVIFPPVILRRTLAVIVFSGGLRMVASVLT